MKKKSPKSKPAKAQPVQAQETQQKQELTPQQAAKLAIATTRNLILTGSYTLDKLPQVNAAIAFLDSLMQQVTSNEGAQQ